MFQHIDGKKSLSIQKNTVCDFCMFALVSKFLFVLFPSQFFLSQESLNPRSQQAEVYLHLV